MKILIIEARYYNNIADMLLASAKEALKEARAEFDIVTVNGALEIPTAICLLKDKYDAFVALGCVIRGETYHFDIVANESARGIMQLGLQSVIVGNGILTTENEQQAIERGNKGYEAAKACLALLGLKN